MPEGSQTQNPQTTPLPEKSERNWKKILLVLLPFLFLISLVGVGLYLLIPRLTEGPTPITQPQKQATPSATTATPSAKKDETADWKTYSSKDFSFKYPPSWKQVIAPHGNILLTLNNETVLNFQPTLTTIKEDSYSNYVKNLESDLSRFSDKQTTTKEKLINSNKVTEIFYYVDLTGIGETKKVSIIVRKNEEQVVKFETKTKNLTTVEILLSTFRFE